MARSLKKAGRTGFFLRSTPWRLPNSCRRTQAAIARICEPDGATALCLRVSVETRKLPLLLQGLRFHHTMSSLREAVRRRDDPFDKRILLIIGGGIAAYKALDLIRRLRERGASVRAVMTAAAQEFVTPLSVGALTADRVFTDLFDRNDEHDVGHIRLSREADLIVVAPATADLMAKLASGLANDLASAVLLATDKQVLMAPAMNPKMWAHPATRRNRATLAKDGVLFVGPNARRDGRERRGGRGPHGRAAGDRRGDRGDASRRRRCRSLAARSSSPRGRRMSRSTRCAISPTARRGKQGHALAAALAALGAEVRLVSGPVALADPAGVKTTHVETAREMRDAVEAQLPADAAVFVAAVADWRTENAAGEKIKKIAGEGPPALRMVENPDILATIGHHASGPILSSALPRKLRMLIANAAAKLKRKGADFIVANDVSVGAVGGAASLLPRAHETGRVASEASRVGVAAIWFEGEQGPRTAGLTPPPACGRTLPSPAPLGGGIPGGVMGGDRNRVKIVSRDGIEAWPEMSKTEVAARLAALIAEKLRTIAV